MYSRDRPICPETSNISIGDIQGSGRVVYLDDRKLVKRLLAELLKGQTL
jgi:hypothetical protein